MKAGTQNHLKMRRLQKALGIPLYQAVGILETLWLLAADCADDGVIGKFSDQEIADYLGWEKNASEIVRALTDTGWTVRGLSGKLEIHDWFDHCPNFIKDRHRKREARGAKKAKARGRPRKQTTYVQSDADNLGTVRDKSGPTADMTENVTSIPNQSQPILSLQNSKNILHGLPSEWREGEIAEAIQAWCRAYFERTGKTHSDMTITQLVWQWQSVKGWTPEKAIEAISYTIANPHFREVEHQEDREAKFGRQPAARESAYKPLTK